MSLLSASRAPLSIDLVALSMFVVVPVLTLGLALARRGRYLAHRRVQVGLSLTVLAVLVMFEVEIRTRGWVHLAEPSPYYDRGLFPFLYFHVTLAVTTTLLWIATIALALRRFPNPPRPGHHSRLHKKLAWTAAVFMYVTAVTGVTFFWMAFVA